MVFISSRNETGSKNILSVVWHLDKCKSRRCSVLCRVFWWEIYSPKNAVTFVGRPTNDRNSAAPYGSTHPFMAYQTDMKIIAGFPFAGVKRPHMLNPCDPFMEADGWMDHIDRLRGRTVFHGTSSPHELQGNAQLRIHSWSRPDWRRFPSSNQKHNRTVEIYIYTQIYIG